MDTARFRSMCTSPWQCWGRSSLSRRMPGSSSISPPARSDAPLPGPLASWLVLVSLLHLPCSPPDPLLEGRRVFGEGDELPIDVAVVEDHRDPPDPGFPVGDHLGRHS